MSNKYCITYVYNRVPFCYTPTEIAYVYVHVAMTDIIPAKYLHMYTVALNQCIQDVYTYMYMQIFKMQINASTTN